MTIEKKQILTVKNIRNINIENMMQSVLRNKDINRSMLAKENSISLMTVKHIVDDLLESKILIEKDSDGVGVGRKPEVLEIAPHYGNIVCLNLTSKDEISFLVYDIYGKLLEEQSITLEEGRTYKEALEAVVNKVKKKLESISTVTVGIAVFVPSAYDANLDLVNYDLIPDFKELHMKSFFEQKFGIKNILILHDVFAAARAEYDSSFPKEESQFYFYCGYGVGGFFIHKDEPVTGAENMAGEVGKMLVSTKGGSSSNEILEDVVSVSAVKQTLKKHGMEMRFSELLERYREGDRQAVQILDPVLNTVDRVLYNLLWVYNPSRVVIDSCKEEYSSIITEHFQKFMEKMKNDAIPIHVQITEAQHKEYQTMKGSFYMVRNAWIEEIAEGLRSVGDQ